MRFRNSWMSAVVTDIKKVADTVFQIKIQALDGTHPFTVGSHIDISVLVNGVPEVRSYSLVGQYESDQPYTIAVKLLENSRGGSKYMSGLEKGNRIKISSPLNHFELSHKANQYLLVAGGIGITPLIGMAKELKKKGADVFMIYIGKQASEMPFIEELQELLGDKLILHYSNKDGMYNLENILDFVSSCTFVYLCGPLGLMNALRKIWEESDYNNAKPWLLLGPEPNFLNQDSP